MDPEGSIDLSESRSGSNRFQENLPPLLSCGHDLIIESIAQKHSSFKNTLSIRRTVLFPVRKKACRSQMVIYVLPPPGISVRDEEFVVVDVKKLELDCGTM
jgi:hypothetical protein